MELKFLQTHEVLKQKVLRIYNQNQEKKPRISCKVTLTETEHPSFPQ